eukprot:s1673_g18.t1
MNVKTPDSILGSPSLGGNVRDEEEEVIEGGIEGRTERHGGLAKETFVKVLDEILPSNKDEWKTCVYAVGQDEFNQQWAKHGESRYLSKLAKTVGRIILVMGLEPGVVAGMEIPGSGEAQCDVGDSLHETGGKHFWVFFWMLVLFLLWLGLVSAFGKFVRQVMEEFRQHACQVADRDRCLKISKNAVNNIEQVGMALR